MKQTKSSSMARMTNRKSLMNYEGNERFEFINQFN
jgi:hypothetical protein